MVESDYGRMLSISRRLAQFESIGKLLGWDQQTYLPSNGSELRAQQRALIAGLRHELLISNEVQDLLDRLIDSDAIRDAGPEAEAEVRDFLRNHQRERRIPSRLVEEIQTTVGLARGPWLEARKQERFELFGPWLVKLVKLSQERAAALGFADEPYDALLEDFERDLKMRDLLPVLQSLEEALRSLAVDVSESGRHPDTSFLSGAYDPQSLANFARQVAARIGFDFNAGRMDSAGSSFCFGLHPQDVRLATGGNVANPLDNLFAAIHEVGHGLYHQGLPPVKWGTPLGRGASLGIHEAQARWWENFIARSEPFWSYFFPHLQAAFPERLRDVTTEAFYAAINIVRPSFIRVEADEVTYNLHIVVRTTLERNLINGLLSVNDLPEAWNCITERVLGIRPPNDCLGVLQDVHWPMAMFGYFPTYALGNVYAAQLDHRIRQDIPELDDQVRGGEFSEALGWMRTRIHQHGALYAPSELISRACGESLRVHRLTDYFESKFRPLYGL